jgi:nicotinamide-nucleotide amidase
MNAEIISIGTELLLGRVVNTNAAYLSRKLAELGIDVYYHTTVGDNPRRLTEAIRRAQLRSDIVIMTGGLGPTVDDITTETLAFLTGKKLMLNRTVLKDLKDYFKMRGFKMPPNNMKQAYLPDGVKWIRNRVGTAPGLLVEWRGKTIVALPGPPRELYLMFDSGVEPILKKRFKVRGVFVTRTIKTTGLPESYVNRAVKDLLELRPPTTVGIYAKLGQVELVIMSKASSRAKAKAAIKKVESKIRLRLKDNIFGYDNQTLEGAAAAALISKKKTIAVAESCTGGLISSRLTDVSGSSKYFVRGAVPYSNEVKVKYVGVSEDSIRKYGAVSRQVALELARGIKSIMGVDVSIGVTGIAGPAGGTRAKPVGLVWMALVTGGRIVVRKFRFTGSRADVKWQASCAALDLIRRNV